MIIIQTTVDDDKKANELINLLVETNKIACGTFHEIQSSYKWKEKLVEEQEFELSMYTKESLIREVVDVVTQRHPYDCLLYTSPSPRDTMSSRMPSSA